MNPPFPLAEVFGEDLTPTGPGRSVAGGFSGATVLRIPCRSGIFAVRGWPEPAEPDRLRGLHRLLAHVARAGVPVAVPLVDGAGRTLVRHTGRWWQVEPWLPGTAELRVSPTVRRLDAAMGTLAAFHAAAATFEPRLAECEWFGGPAFGVPGSVSGRKVLLVERVLGVEGRRLAAAAAVASGEFGELARRVTATFGRLGPRCFDELSQAESIPVPLIPALRDLRADHVLFTGEAVTGVVDLAACRRDCVAADLARLLGSLPQADPRFREAAIAAYRKRRSLTSAEASLVPVLYRCGTLLSAVTWLRRRYVHGVDCEKPEVIGRLADLALRLSKID